MKAYRLLPFLALSACSDGIQERPNVIIILADDLGCGDISALGSPLLKTPNLDRLCDSGLNLLDGHSTAPTSTPSRYSLMTGLYPWRNKDAEILTGDANLLIHREQPTIAKMMQEAGYATAVIGKWHLGLGEGKIDWNREISPSPKDVGFDYSYIIAATVDRVPTVYVENGVVPGLDPSDPLYVDYHENFPGEPTALTNPELMRIRWSQGHSCSVVNGIPRIGYMKGGKSAHWVDEDMADVFLGKVKEYIDSHQDEPFFLCYNLHQPHVPRTPHQRFVGTSGLGPRGDAVLEADWCVGELLDYLEAKGLDENTLIVFTSDNGPVLDDGYVDYAKENWGGVSPAAPYRGGKYSLFDGGTHVPFFVSWKGRVPAGKESQALVTQMDLYASLASLVGQDVPESLDSENLLDAFLGQDDKGRREMVFGSNGRLSFRCGKLHLIPPYDGPALSSGTEIETGNSDSWMLYDLSADIAEQTDINSLYPDKVSAMQSRMHEMIFH